MHLSTSTRTYLALPMPIGTIGPATSACRDSLGVVALHHAVGAGGIVLTMHDIWFDAFEMRLWGLTSCCDCL